MTDKLSPGRPRVRPIQSTPTGERIGALQARLGLSTAHAARYLGVSVSTYRSWVDGQREPGAVLTRLLDVLGALEVMAPEIHSQLIESAR
jgi:DNA-binding transcriptional regulator YiaG